MPQTIEGGEPRGGQRLVHRGPVGDPRITLGDRGGEARQCTREPRIHQTGVRRPRSVVQQAGDRADPELLQAAEPLVDPAPVEAVGRLWRNALPKHRITQRLEPQAGEQLQIPGPGLVTATQGLVEEPVADAVDGAFVAAPQFQVSHSPAAPSPSPPAGSVGQLTPLRFGSRSRRAASSRNPPDAGALLAPCRAELRPVQTDGRYSSASQ